VLGVLIGKQSSKHADTLYLPLLCVYTTVGAKEYGMRFGFFPFQVFMRDKDELTKPKMQLFLLATQYRVTRSSCAGL